MAGRRGASALLDALGRAQASGFLGPGPAEAHLEHGMKVADALGPFEGRFLDLGSGGGVPGLVLAVAWPQATAVLLDAARRRCELLRRAVVELQLQDRVSVVEGRAEELGRDATLRARFELVVARAFGRPAVTAECGGAFVTVGGRLVVTEPPEAAGTRWPTQGLARLGLGPARSIGDPGAHLAVIPRPESLDARYPRRTGIPAKRPLWP